MALSSRTVRIGAALLLSAFFIGAGYYFSSPFQVTTAGAASNDALLKEYAKKDTDADGLPDWQEALYGTDAQNAHSVDPSMTDGEAVAAGKIKPKFTSEAPAAASVSEGDFSVAAPAADSVTEQFGKSFIQDYLASGQAGTGANNDALVQGFISDFNTAVAAKLRSSYSASSVRVSSAATVASYAAAVEAALRAHNGPAGAGNPITLADTYITQGDAASHANLLLLAQAYASTATDLAAIAVPPQLADAHLLLMRSVDQFGKATRAVADYQKDPLATLGALAAYTPASADMASALTSIGNAVLAEGEPSAGSPGAYIVQLVRGIPAP